MKALRTSALIAVRELVCEADQYQKFTVKLARPKRNPDKVDFSCDYQIMGLGVDIRRCAFGLDAFQALQLACVAIGAHLAEIGKRLGGSLTWQGGDSGFPDN